MPIEAEKYLPPEGDMIKSFAKANSLHCNIGNSVDEILTRVSPEELPKVARDYLGAGLAYFTNRNDDDYLEEVGVTAWNTIKQKRMGVVITTDTRGALILYGLSPEAVANINEKEPQIVFYGKSEGKVRKEGGIVLLPLELILLAKRNPIEALASMAYIFSQVRDFSNGRLYIDRDFMQQRAKATEAHFLKEAVRQYPQVCLGSYYYEVLAEYPEGIYSLPKEALYKGSTGEQARNAHLN